MDIKKLLEHLKAHEEKLDAEIVLKKRAEFIKKTFSELFKSFDEFCDIETTLSEDIKTLGLERLYETADDKHQIEILKKFLSYDYKPPDNLPELLSHISSIFLYQNLFRQTDSIPSTVLLQFDLVLAKLTQKAKYEATVWTLKSGKDRNRIAESRVAMRKDTDEKSKQIISAYEGLIEKYPNKSLNWIAGEIQKTLSNDDLKITTKTIKNYISRHKKKRTKTFESDKIYYLKNGQIRQR